eukprot:6675194-Pyramimonas_sp.AAC.1
MLAHRPAIRENLQGLVAPLRQGLQQCEQLRVANLLGPAWDVAIHAPQDVASTGGHDRRPARAG